MAFRINAAWQQVALLVLPALPHLCSSLTLQHGSAHSATYAGSEHGCQGKFLHGVASGDPLSNAIVVWTRLTPEASTAWSNPLSWSIWEASPDSGDSSPDGTLIASGGAWANATTDFTVKVDVVDEGLQPGVEYVYQFQCGNTASPIGRFHLPPAAPKHMEKLKYAIFSCSNWGWGHFTAYGAAAASHDLDFWLHLGDFIYESGDAYPPPEEVIRGGLEPQHDLVSLQDYRQRLALYRTDPSLQLLSSKAPSITIWDDHEIVNNAWARGGSRHYPHQGSFADRVRNAMQAYHEWMPTRKDPTMEDPPYMKWRRFDFGDLATMLVLETRLLHRMHGSSVDTQVITDHVNKLLKVHDYPPPDTWHDSELDKELQAVAKMSRKQSMAPDSRILGTEQMEWMELEMQESVREGITWQLLAQGEIMQPMMTGDFLGAVKQAKEKGSIEASQWEHAVEQVAKGDTEADHRAQVDLAEGAYGILRRWETWSGYGHEYERLLALFHGAGSASNPVVYSGETHNAWVGQLRDQHSKEVVAVEFAGMSVSSPGIERHMPWCPWDLQVAAHKVANPDTVWADTHNRGFMLVELTHAEHTVTYYSVDVHAANSTMADCLASFQLVQGSKQIQPVACQQHSPRATTDAVERASGPIATKTRGIVPFGQNSTHHF
mmetsp:Transcript_11000/g.19919  ORF Transcript_11000/g.19919 Transcript_11000/m.19919 type:complete len:661 (-) Transcript_11000:80-2062(-)